MKLNYYPFNLDKHVSILFELLLTRKHIISHQTAIRYEEHVAFCSQHPYREWYVIEYQEKIIGSFYLTMQNNVGININIDNQEVYGAIIRFIVAKFTPLAAKASVIPKDFVINVPPSNTSLEKAIQQASGVLLQKTYQL